MSFITFDIFNNFPELICIFSNRKGGTSKGKFSSLNLGIRTGDLIENIESNRNILFNKLGINGQDIAFAEQIHSANATIINKPGLYPETDAMICANRGIFLSVLTADCFPVFLYVPGKHIVAVIHVGWRGVSSGIIKNVFRILLEDFHIIPSDIYSAIGPGIQYECFKVKEDVYTLFPEKYIVECESKKKKYLNLQQYIIDQIEQYEVPKSQIYAVTSCTKCMKDEYLSHRRDGSKSGRMMGIIGIKKAFS